MGLKGFLEGLRRRQGTVSSYEEMKPRVVEFDDEHEAKGVYELILSGPVRCLPKNRYIVTERQVRILDAKRIPYRSLSLDTVSGKPSE